MGKAQIIVRRYQTQRQYQGDARKWVKRGYRVVSVASEQPRAGCGRILAIGIFALLWKPQPVLVVTYQLA